MGPFDIVDMLGGGGGGYTDDKDLFERTFVEELERVVKVAQKTCTVDKIVAIIARVTIPGKIDRFSEASERGWSLDVSILSIDRKKLICFGSNKKSYALFEFLNHILPIFVPHEN